MITNVIGTTFLAKRIVCIAPERSDKLILMNHEHSVITAVQSAFQVAWCQNLHTFLSVIDGAVK